MTAAGGGGGGVPGTWVFSERHELALELLSVGRRLADQRGGPLAAVAFDAGRAAEYRARGADRSLAFEPASGTAPAPEAAVAALASVVAGEEVGILLVGATAYGTEVAARLAQRLRVGCASECLSLDAGDGALVVERRCLGRFVTRQRLTATPAIATVPSRRFDPPAGDGAPAAGAGVEVRSLEAPPPRVRVVETRPRATSQVALGEADALVAVGRGLRRPEDLDVVRDLADAVGGVLVATRPLTDDLKWLPVDVKVGLSGQTVKPGAVRRLRRLGPDRARGGDAGVAPGGGRQHRSERTHHERGGPLRRRRPVRGRPRPRPGDPAPARGAVAGGGRLTPAGPAAPPPAERRGRRGSGATRRRSRAGSRGR